MTILTFFFFFNFKRSGFLLYLYLPQSLAYIVFELSLYTYFNFLSFQNPPRQQFFQ